MFSALVIFNKWRAHGKSSTIRCARYSPAGCSQAPFNLQGGRPVLLWTCRLAARTLDCEGLTCEAAWHSKFQSDQGTATQKSYSNYHTLTQITTVSPMMRETPTGNKEQSTRTWIQKGYVIFVCALLLQRVHLTTNTLVSATASHRFNSGFTLLCPWTPL